MPTYKDIISVWTAAYLSEAGCPGDHPQETGTEVLRFSVRHGGGAFQHGHSVAMVLNEHGLVHGSRTQHLHRDIHVNGSVLSERIQIAKEGHVT